MKCSIKVGFIIWKKLSKSLKKNCQLAAGILDAGSDERHKLYFIWIGLRFYWWPATMQYEKAIKCLSMCNVNFRFVFDYICSMMMIRLNDLYACSVIQNIREFTQWSLAIFTQVISTQVTQAFSVVQSKDSEPWDLLKGH